MEGNSEDASLRAPGRNERRSAGHGKRGRFAEFSVFSFQSSKGGRFGLNHQKSGRPAMAVASSGFGQAKDSPIQMQLKKKGSLGEWNPRPPSSEDRTSGRIYSRTE
jgi:hypothetical protein